MNICCIDCGAIVSLLNDHVPQGWEQRQLWVKIEQMISVRDRAFIMAWLCPTCLPRKGYMAYDAQ